MTWVTVNRARVRMRHEEGPGGGATVVLLHMAGGGSSVWGPVASLLGRRARVLAPDFPGHGQSDPAALPPPPAALVRPGVSARVASLAAWTLDFLDATDTAQAVLCGHSMGGAVALCCALWAPQRVRAVGTVCTPARLRVPADILDLLEHQPDAFAPFFTGAALPVGADAGAQLRVRPVFPQASREEVLADFRGVQGMDLGLAVAGLPLPAAVLGGMMDTLTPPPDIRALADALPASTLSLVEGAGHMLPREQPKAVSDALAALLTR